MIAVPPLFTSCIQPVFAPVRCSLTSGSLTGTGREHLLPYIFCTAFWVFRFKSYLPRISFKKPCSRWVSLSAASLHVLLFLSTFYILLMIRAASRFVKKFFSSDSSPAPHRQSASPLPCSPPSSLLFPDRPGILQTLSSAPRTPGFCKYGFVSPIVPSDTPLAHQGLHNPIRQMAAQSLLSLFTFPAHGLRTSYEPVPIRTRRQNACRFANTSSI